MKIIENWEAKQEEPITHINTLDDCFSWLKSVIGNYRECIGMNEEDATIIMQRSIGRFVRNTLKLWEDCNKIPKYQRSQLVQYFNDIGIYHPDDMSGIILTSFWRYLNEKHLNVDEQVITYKKHWDKHDPRVNTGILT